MKNLKVTLAAMMIALFAVVGTNNVAKAQITTGEQVIAAAGNLVNVQVGSVNVDDVITIGDIDIDVDDVVDVTNVLNNNDIDILRDFLNNLTIDNVLNNLLREAEIIKGNQVVVGVAILGEVPTLLVASKKTLGLK